MSEANQLRLVASEIICKLHEAGEMTHLELLQAHAQRAIEEMQKQKMTQELIEKDESES